MTNNNTTIKLGYNKAFTHSGIFHADDVFSTAFLRMINPDIVIERGFKAPEEEGVLVFDIGMGAFDHHQQDVAIRPNGIKYAAFGLLWSEFGHMLAGDIELRDRIDSEFVQAIDHSDNTGVANPISLAISSFNPTWDSTVKADDAFEEAVEYAKAILEKVLEGDEMVLGTTKRFLEGVFSKMACKEIADKALADAKDGIVILPRFIPWQEYIVGSGNVFVVYPSLRGGYQVQVVPKELGKQAAVKDLPASWAGLKDTELAKVSGIADAVFCHPGRFVAGATSLEGTIAMAYKALED